MPSTTSSTVSADFDSSTVMTPSLPTFSIASAIRLPIVLSLFEAIVATWAISFLSFVDLESFFSSSVTASTAAAMPRLSPIGLAPAVTLRSPSRQIACASTVAEGVFVAQNPVLIVVTLHFGAGVLPEEDRAAILDVERDLLPVLGPLAIAHGDDLALLGLLLPRVRYDDAALFHFLLLESLDENAVVQRTNLHRSSASFVLVLIPIRFSRRPGCDAHLCPLSSLYSARC